MAEKRGHLEKLRYEFSTSAHLEVWVEALQDWYRVTPTTFRSYDSKRRITQPDKVVRGIENTSVKLITTQYNGPVYEWGTNIVVPYTGKGGTVQSVHSQKLTSISEKRPY